MEKHGMPLVLLLVGIAVGIFLAGHWVPSVSAVSGETTRAWRPSLTFSPLSKKNYEEVDTKNLVTGAINGMLSGLDRCTAPISRPTFIKSCNGYAGTLWRIGNEITVKGGS
jgi:hypothetical protein